MNPAPLIRSYELLVDKADMAFEKMGQEHGSCICCKRHCSDCCHAVFGLFLIEVVYIKQHFDQLESNVMREALLRSNDTERALKRMEIKLQKHEDDPETQAYIMAKERVRCPLLDENEECILYPHRPITCRVYGIPTKIQGKARVCGKTGFMQGQTYPVFDLEGVYANLYALTTELLNSTEQGNPEKAGLLISVAKAINTPTEEILYESFG